MWVDCAHVPAVLLGGRLYMGNKGMMTVEASVVVPIITIATGILNSNLNGDNIVSIPLDIEDPIELVYIKHEKTALSKMGEKFIEYLLEEVKFDK